MKRLPWGRLGVLVGFALAVGLGVALLRQTDLRAVGDSLARAQIWPWIPLAAVTHLGGHALRGLRTRLCFGPAARIGTVDCTAAVVAGYASNNLLPARLGELVRMRMLARASGRSFASAAGVVVLERVADAAVLLALALLFGGAAFAGALASFRWPVVGAGLGAGILLSLAVGLIVGGRFLKRAAPRLRRKLGDLVNQLSAGVRHLARPAALASFAALSAGIWLSESAVFTLVFVAFGLPPDAWLALASMSLTNLGLIAPSVPGYVGSFHFFYTRTLVLSGVPAATALAAAAVTHLSLVVPTCLAGVLVALRHFRRNTSRGNADSGVERVVTLHGHSRSTSALVRALAPQARELDPISEAQVLADVTRFLDAQLADLPLRLKLALRAGLFGVAAFSWVRYGESLVTLDPDRRREFVERLAYGRFWPFRALLRPLRANVFIGYYDHPLLSERRVVPELIQLHAG